jgi:hypothetical protein
MLLARLVAIHSSTPGSPDEEDEEEEEETVGWDGGGLGFGGGATAKENVEPGTAPAGTVSCITRPSAIRMLNRCPGAAPWGTTAV